MKLLATLGALLFSGIIAAAPLHHVVVFGDSLSDNGNLYELMKHQLPQSPPYFEGRFSNGPVWIELLMASYFPSSVSQHLFDYAFGGAGVSEEAGDEELFTLKREINAYLLTHNDKASEDSLYVIWIGGNNYLAMPTDVEKTLQTVNEGIVHSVQVLLDKGAKHFLILNLPDLGRTPAAIEFNAVDMMNHYSTVHNEWLKNTVIRFREQYPDVTWHYYDVGNTFKKLVNHPDEYGLTNITGTCYTSDIHPDEHPSVLKIVANIEPAKSNTPCDGYLFFDLVHPTAAIHKILAEEVRELLDREGLVFSD